ncbi:MAG TPA: TonB-dependent receptor [Bacteroidia bacterium]|nr:TonB-dependent receptor [Bacteroidia bacterium]
MKKILFFALLIISFLFKAQEITVRDRSTYEPLVGVVLKDINNNSVLTNVKGKADISTLNIDDSITVYLFGYNERKVKLRAESMSNPIELSAKAVVLNEIVFSANRTSEKKIDVPYQMEIIKQKNIEFGMQPTTGEVVMNTGAVFVQKSQQGGSSPVLRGFEASRVLMVVDGVRMNNAIYRAGHLQDIITLDANMMDRVEVIFGPSSTMYGSDALGGVMHFYTKNAEFSTDDKMLVKTNAMMRFASVNNEFSTHLDFNIGTKNFASMTNITHSQFGDLMSGSTKLPGGSKAWDRKYYAQRIGDRDSMIVNENDNLQTGTSYDQLDIMQRFAIRTGEHLTQNINFQMSQSGDVPRYDRLTEYSGTKLKWAEWYYGPQKRMLGAYTLNYDSRTAISDNVKVIFAYQKVDQDRITRRFQSANKVSQLEDVSVLSANIDVFKKIREEHELRYGIEVTGNDVKSTANNLNIATGSVSPAVTRYADGGSKMNTGAFYLAHSWEVNSKFVVSSGIRGTATSLVCNFNDTTFYKFPFKIAEQKNQSLTGNIGFTWKEEDNYKVSLLFNTGFRAPNVDDMSKVFGSAGSIVVVPNPDIKPEYATNIELGLSKVFAKRYKFDIAAYYTSMQNAIVQRDFKYNGSDSVLFGGVKSKVQAMQNTDWAYIYGINGGVQFDFNDNISFKSNVNITYGRYIDVVKDTVYALDHIPPVFGQTSLIYKEKNADAEFFVRYNGKKSSGDYSPSGEDNANYSADPIKGYMPGWFTLNLRAGVNLYKGFRINFACENITDNRYRVFASGINGPGRNFIVSLRYKF